MKKVLLTSLQSHAIATTLMKSKVVYGDRSDSEFEAAEFGLYHKAYDWMIAAMRKRIGPPPSGAKDPLWAWAKWDTHRAPVDLRHLRSHGSRGGDGFWRIDLEVPLDRVVLSDYELWHFPLNDWAITRRDEVSESVKLNSWEKVFQVTSRTRSIQATLWEFRMEWVVRMSHHRKAARCRLP